MSGEAIATPPAERSLIETHISSLVLAGDTVYKLHKPLKLDFLDFSTPELRRADSLEELRLNRRTAPQIYLDVLPIVGTPQTPSIASAGDAAQAFDWVLRMRRFEQDALLDAMAREGRLTEAHIDALAERIAAFHAALPPAPPQFGRPEEVRHWALVNLDALQRAAASSAQTARIDALRAWTEREGQCSGAVLGIDRARAVEVPVFAVWRGCCFGGRSLCCQPCQQSQPCQQKPVLPAACQQSDQCCCQA